MRAPDPLQTRSDPHPTRQRTASPAFGAARPPAPRGRCELTQPSRLQQTFSPRFPMTMIYILSDPLRF